MSAAIKEVKPQQFRIVDEDERLVEGWASCEVIDAQGDIVPISELEKAMFKFMDRGGLIIYGHSNKPVGKVLQWSIEKHPEIGVYGVKFVAKIFKDYPLDDEVWKAIKEGKLKGFSIGAQAKEEKRLVKDESSGLPKEVGILRDLNLMEISIVEQPANPLAVIESVNYFAKGNVKNKVSEKKKNMMINLNVSDVKKAVDSVKEKIFETLDFGEPISYEEFMKQQVRDERPPKDWWNRCVRIVWEGKPDYTEEQVRAICGSMWYHGWGLGAKKSIVEKQERSRKVDIEPIDAPMRVSEEESKEFDNAIHEFGEVEKEKNQGNPWAICRAAQKKYGWSEEKFERCVLHVKERLGIK